MVLRVLWVTGLRLGEALQLSWTKGPFRLALDGEFPLLEIAADSDKSGRASVLPLTPEAVAWFRSTPERERRGLVLAPKTPDGRILNRLDTISKTIARLGRLAGVVVSTDPVRYASAHDLRRSFAARLAPRVRAPLLQQLMRHSSIQTTLTYYATADAQAVARELYRDVTQNGPEATDLGEVANRIANTDHVVTEPTDEQHEKKQ
jgi:integrase